MAVAAIVLLLTKKVVLAGGCGLVILFLTLVLFRASISDLRSRFPKWGYGWWLPSPSSRSELVLGMLLILAFTLGAIAVIVWQEVSSQ